MFMIRPRPIAASVAFALGLALSATGASAQEDIDPAIDHLIEAGTSTKAALAAAAEQEAQGDMLGAASTLERALIHNPRADDVRLAYATTLCKLDDPESAAAELRVLRGRPTGKSGWDAMLDACGPDMANFHRHKGHFSGTVTAGAAYDGNSADMLSSFASFFPASKDGLAFVGSLQVDAKVPVGSLYAFGSGFALTHDDQSGPSNDYQYGEFVAGLGKESEKVEFSLGGVIRHGRIQGDSYFTAYGGQARISLQSGSSGRFDIVGEVTHENFADFFSDGTRYDLLIGYGYDSPTNRRFFVGVGGEVKDTASFFRSYKSARAVGWMELPIGTKGIYATASATLRYVEFDDGGFGFEHKEWRLFTRAAVGVPLVGRSLYIEPTVTFRYRDYNAASFLDDYSSVGGELRLVWKF